MAAPLALRERDAVLAGGLGPVEGLVGAPDELLWGVFYGVSNNKWKFWDISDAERLIGYRPQDNMEDYRGKVEQDWPAR